MTDQTLATRAEQAVETPKIEGGSLLAVIANAARDKDVDMDKFERLVVIQERMEQRAAEAAFNEAMKEAQKEMRPIAADADNPSTKSKYASYAALDKALRPIYTKHGFALSFDEGDTPKPDHIRVLCYVSHEAGFTRVYRKDMPADGKGAKGGDVMTKTHATGAAASYGSRYLLKGIFNVAVGGEDTDGNDIGETISLEEVADLQTKLAAVDGDIAAFCEHFKISALADLPAKYLPTAFQIIANKAKKMGK